MLGALPLALGNGIGSELRKPLGVSIVGGLLLSQLITLYTTPVIYLYFERLSDWLRRRRERALSRCRRRVTMCRLARAAGGRARETASQARAQMRVGGSAR